MSHVHDHGTEISPTCEILVSHSDLAVLCGLSTVAGFPCGDGGWMALCAIHVVPHEKYSMPAEDIRNGIALAMLENGSRG